MCQPHKSKRGQDRPVLEAAAAAAAAAAMAAMASDWSGWIARRRS